MVRYSCDACCFASNIKTHYNRHLTTKKHIRNQEKLSSENIKTMDSPSEKLQKTPILGEFTSNLLQIPPANTFLCEFCQMAFSRRDNLIRHETKRCKKREISYKDLFFDMKKQLEKEKKEFKKQIEILLHKVGDTTINNTQNIQLNNYGNEDMSHITDNLKTQLIKGPYGMITKLIEAVHFNDAKPENKNIALTNKKDNRIQIFTGNKWIYKNKSEVLNDLIDGKYFILDTHYDDICNTLDNVNKLRYSKFRYYFDEKTNKLFYDLTKECELLLLNNR